MLPHRLRGLAAAATLALLPPAAAAGTAPLPQGNEVFVGESADELPVVAD